nr:MAG TPA: Major capsid protein [Caudoviricetes sp.]
MADTNTNVNATGDNTGNNSGDNSQNNQNVNTSSNTNQQNTSNNTVDKEKIKNDAIAEYLKGLGVEDGDTLKGIVAKAKEEEEKNKTDLEKSNDTLTATTKELVAEREARIMAEAKLSAIQLGAKTELVDDLVIIAKAKVTKDKDINAIIAEIKDSTNGKIYFSDDEEEQQKGTVTRKRVNKNPETNNQSEKNKDKNANNNGAEQHKGTMAERLLANRVKPKSHYFSK